MHFVPQFEPVAFAVEMIGDTGSFAIGVSNTLTKLYKLGVESDEDKLPFVGVALHLSINQAVGAGVLHLQLVGSLDGTQADGVDDGGGIGATDGLFTAADTLQPQYKVTIPGTDIYHVTRSFNIMDHGLCPYFGFLLYETANSATVVATAKRFRMLSAAG